MRVLIAIATALSLSACAAAPDPAEASKAFTQQARKVAAEWRDSDAARKWGEGLVLADRSIHLPKDWPEAQYFDDPSLMAGDFRLDTELPGETPPNSVTLPDTETEVEVWDAGEAYDILTDVDVSSGDPRFVITEIEAGTEQWYTNHGLVDLPVWKYTMDGYAEPVVQVAFDVESVSQPPRVPAPDTDFAGAAGLDAVDDTTLTFDVDASCLTGVTPLIHETGDLVLLGGSGTETGDTECMPAYDSVTVELGRELGDRVVLDAIDGTVLRFNEIYGA